MKATLRLSSLALAFAAIVRNPKYPFADESAFGEIRLGF